LKREVIPKWPTRFDSNRGEDVPSELVGATIAAIGTLEVPYRERPEGGGLVIDYRPAGVAETKRITLAFTETGMWIHPPIRG
jgi:hypothetical protein